MTDFTRRPGKPVLPGIVLLMALSPFAIAGDLEPPGPPAATMKDLDTVEARTPIRAADMPLTITVPGSYYLVEDILAAGGITIGTTCVTIDLNGFALFGSASTGDGISAVAGAESIEIKNGVVSGWAEDGIDLAGVKNARVFDVRVARNGQDGVVLGDDSVLRASLISLNDRYGVLLDGSGSLVTDNLINENVSSGIQVTGAEHQILDNSISRNQLYGISVVDFADYQIIVDNVLTNNVGISLQFGEFSVGHIVTRNIARRAAGANSNNRPGDWGVESTAAASTSPAGNISN